MFGIGVPELLILFVLPGLIWVSYKLYRKTFKQIRSIEKMSKEGIDVAPDSYKNIDMSDFSFIADKLLSEDEVVSNIEEIPLDNRHGSSPIVSEHEFSRTVHNSLNFGTVKEMSGLVKTSVWTLIQTEVKKNLKKTIGAEIEETITRRATVRLEAAPGKMVKYELVWKQKQRTGNALINIRNKEVQIPYTSMHGLFHSVQSIDITSANKTISADAKSRAAE